MAKQQSTTKNVSSLQLVSILQLVDTSGCRYAASLKNCSISRDIRVVDHIVCNVLVYAADFPLAMHVFNIFLYHNQI